MILIADCIEAAATYFDISREAMVGRGKQRIVAYPRFFAMLAARRLTRASYPQIGKMLNRDHTTVLWGERQALKLIDVSETYATAAAKIEESVAMIEADRVLAGMPPAAPDWSVTRKNVRRAKQFALAERRLMLWTPAKDEELLTLWRASLPWVEIGNRLGVCVCIARYRLRKLRARGAGHFDKDAVFTPLIRHKFM